MNTIGPKIHGVRPSNVVLRLAIFYAFLGAVALLATRSSHVFDIISFPFGYLPWLYSKYFDEIKLQPVAAVGLYVILYFMNSYLYSSISYAIYSLCCALYRAKLP